MTGRLLILTLVAVVGYSVYSRYAVRHYDPMWSDLKDGQKISDAIHLAEAKCRQKLGRYANLKEIIGNDCVTHEVDLTSAEIEGFALTLDASSVKYSFTLNPVDELRLASFYSDESHILRIGTRSAPANASSRQVNSALESYP